MIADLEADSESWAAERRVNAARNTPVVDYRSSQTHQSTTETTLYAVNYHLARGDLAKNHEISDKPPIAQAPRFQEFNFNTYI